MNQCLLPQRTSSQSEEKCNVVIYGLYDPRTDELRYVGKTSVALHLRLARHLRDRRRSYKVSWIQSLKRRGLKPTIRELEKTTAAGWQEAEQRLISHYRASGARLTNLESGGRGGHTVDSTVKEKMRASQLRRLQMLREQHEGIAASPSTRNKLRKNALGHSWNRGWKHTAETKQMLSKIAIERERNLRPFKLGRTTITDKGRHKLSESRRKSSPLFALSDDQWRTLPNRKLAVLCGTTANNVNMYRWKYNKPKFHRHYGTMTGSPVVAPVAAPPAAK